MSVCRDFIVNTIEHYFNKSNLKVDAKSEDTLNDFINNPQGLILHGFVSEENIELYSKIQDDKNKSIVFYKTTARFLTDDEYLNNINVLTLSSNAVESLYHIWRQIYTPLLAVSVRGRNSSTMTCSAAGELSAGASIYA